VASTTDQLFEHSTKSTNCKQGGLLQFNSHFLCCEIIDRTIAYS